MEDDEAMITVGDEVQLSKDLFGIVRFIGEVLQRKGIYYGIELSEPKGKTNGTVGNVRYFKCKSKRGLFLRRTRIQRVFPKNKSSLSTYRIGINEIVQITMNNQYKAVGTIKYIGTPPKSNGIYYGIHFKKPIGDSNGMYHGVRFFTTDRNCAYFIKANSKRIVYPIPNLNDNESSSESYDSGTGREDMINKLKGKRSRKYSSESEDSDYQQNHKRNGSRRSINGSRKNIHNGSKNGSSKNINGSFKKKRRSSKTTKNGKRSKSTQIKKNNKEKKPNSKKKKIQQKKGGKYDGSSSDTDANNDDDTSDTEIDDNDNKNDLESQIMEINKYYNERERNLRIHENIYKSEVRNKKLDKDVMKNVNKEWLINAQNANTFKKRYECTKGLMEKVCGNSSKIPSKFNKSSHDPTQILIIFSKWLEIETHIVVRKHILQLLLPFGQTNYNIQVWSNCVDDMAKNLMTKQWIEKKRGFLPIVTPALISIYIGSYSQIINWKEWIIKALLSQHKQQQTACWQFLASILELSMMRKSLIWIYEDIERLIADEQIISIAKDVLLHTKDGKDLKLSCSLFVYGVVHCYKHIPILQHVYQELVTNTIINIYFDSISQSEYNKLFKPLTIKKRRSHHHHHNGKHVKNKRSHIDLKQSKSAEVKIVANEDDDDESVKIEHLRGKKSLRMDDMSDDTLNDTSDDSDDSYFENRRKIKRKKKSSNKSSRSNSSKKSQSKSKSKSNKSKESLDDKRKKSNSSQDKKQDEQEIKNDTDDDDNLNEEKEEKQVFLREDEESKPHFIEEEEFMDESKFCRNCMKKKGRMQELNVELTRMFKEIDDLKGVISDLKIEKSEFKKDKKQWIVNLDRSRVRYQETLTNKQKMQKELFGLRKQLKELKKRSNKLMNKNVVKENDILDPKDLNEWTMHDILEYIIGLENYKYLKYEQNLYKFFQDNNINGQSLIDGRIKESDLRNCGIYRFGERKQLIKQIMGLIEQYNELQKQYAQELTELNNQRLSLDDDIKYQDEEQPSHNESEYSSDEKTEEPGIDPGQSVLSEQLEGAIKANVSDDEKKRMEEEYKKVQDEQRPIPSDQEIEYNENKNEEPGNDNDDDDDDNESAGSMIIHPSPSKEEEKDLNLDIDKANNNDKNDKNVEIQNNDQDVENEAVDDEKPKRKRKVTFDRGSNVMDINIDDLQNMDDDEYEKFKNNKRGQAEKKRRNKSKEYVDDNNGDNQSEKQRRNKSRKLEDESPVDDGNGNNQNDKQRRNKQQQNEKKRRDKSKKNKDDEQQHNEKKRRNKTEKLNESKVKELLNGNSHNTKKHKRNLSASEPHIRSYSDPMGADLNVLEDIQGLQDMDEYICNQCFKSYHSENDGYADDQDDIWYCNDCWDEFNAEQNAIAAANRQKQENNNNNDGDDSHGRYLSNEVADIILNGKDLFNGNDESPVTIKKNHRNVTVDIVAAQLGSGGGSGSDSDDLISPLPGIGDNGRRVVVNRPYDNHKLDIINDAHNVQNNNEQEQETQKTENAEDTNKETVDENEDKSQEKKKKHVKRKSILDGYQIRKLTEQEMEDDVKSGDVTETETETEYENEEVNEQINNEKQRYFDDTVNADKIKQSSAATEESNAESMIASAFIQDEDDHNNGNNNDYLMNHRHNDYDEEDETEEEHEYRFEANYDRIQIPRNDPMMIGKGSEDQIAAMNNGLGSPNQISMAMSPEISSVDHSNSDNGFGDITL